jgi:signal transduction histidine kinase
VTNARDAMPDGGTLTVMTGNVVLADPAETASAAFAQHPDAPSPTRQRRRYVSLCVSDTGTGMTPATRARAFEPFFTTKPSDCGTGLGMAVVREVVTEAGGDVRIVSTVGVGTTISLVFPAADPAPVG